MPLSNAWREEEIEFLRQNPDWSNQALAAALVGRSEKAIQCKKVKLKPVDQRVKNRPWTDDEYGFIASHSDWTARRLADELGRDISSVFTKRRQIANGWEPKLIHWTAEEDEVILAAGLYATLAGLAEQLPGRSASAIEGRRFTLGVKSVNGKEKDPAAVGRRPLIAKTCPKCALLLPAGWFTWKTKSRTWSSWCRKCASEAGRRAPKPSAIDAAIYHKARNARLKELTESRAENKGKRYTQADHEILSDPELTDLQKAWRLKRTAGAVSTSRQNYGYKSYRSLGDPERDEWHICNPNVAA